MWEFAPGSPWYAIRCLVLTPPVSQTGSLDEVSAVCGTYDEDLGLAPLLRREPGLDAFAYGCHAVDRHQGDRAAAEAAAGHPRAERVGLERRLDGDVELGAADLE